MLDREAPVSHALPAAHTFELRLPAPAMRRVGEHEVEPVHWESVVGQGGAHRAADDRAGGIPLSPEQHSGLSCSGTATRLLRYQRCISARLRARASNFSRSRTFLYCPYGAQVSGIGGAERNTRLHQLQILGSQRFCRLQVSKGRGGTHHRSITNNTGRIPSLPRGRDESTKTSLRTHPCRLFRHGQRHSLSGAPKAAQLRKSRLRSSDRGG